MVLDDRLNPVKLLCRTQLAIQLNVLSLTIRLTEAIQNTESIRSGLNRKSHGCSLT
jgi:hypothetical protein